MSDFDDVFVSVETKEPAQSKEERRAAPKEWWQIREQKEREQAYSSLDRIFADFSEGKGNLCEYLDTYGRIDRYSFRMFHRPQHAGKQGKGRTLMIVRC